MTVECLLARPATGKTAYCVQKAREHAAAKPFANIWVVTPGSYQSRYFRGRLAETKGVFGVNVGTFLNFAQSILERDKATLPIAPISLTNAIIENILDNHRDTNPLTAYKTIEGLPGFVKVLREAFMELIIANIRPRAYAACAETPEEQEIGNLYAEFWDETKRAGWQTQPGMITRAADHLRANLSLAADVSLILVDGFDEFTDVELDLLNAFEKLGIEMVITLPTEVDPVRTAHSRAITTFNKLRSSFDMVITGLTSPPRLPADALAIEGSIFDRSEPYPIPEEDREELPMLLECRSPEAEAREALRWIKERIIRDNVPMSECAIFASDDAEYEGVIRPIAREYGLPIFYFHRKKFGNVPAGAALLRALRLPTANFATNILFSIFHSPYFTYKSLDARVGYLEETARFGKVLRGKDEWQLVWPELEEGHRYGFPEWVRSRAKKKLPPMEEIDSLRSELAEFFAIFPNADEERSYFEWARWLDEALTTLGFYEQIDKEEEKMIRDGLEDAFRTIRLGENLYGAKAVTYTRFAEILSANLIGHTVTDPNESNINSIFFGSFIEGRAVRYKAVCLIGLAEGAFPHRQTEDPFLREEIRARLGMASRLRSDQVSVFYQAVTRSDQYLLITRPALTEKGDAKQPSPYWMELLNCFPQGKVRRIRGEDKPDPRSLASKEEVLFFYASSPGNDLASFETRTGVDIINARKRQEDFNLYNGMLTDLAPSFTELFNPKLIWSSSAVETFGKCAFTFFITKTLGLEEIEEVEEELGVNHIGTMNHAILERLFRENPEERDLETLIARVREIAEDIFASAPRRFNFRPTSLWVLTQQEILKNLIDSLGKLLEAIDAQWIPSEFEFAFGMGQNPPLRVTLDRESMLFRGFIDRIDKNARGELSVLDYKLGAGFAKTDFISGRVIQFMIYALAAEAHFHRDVILSRYWSVNQRKMFGPAWDGPRNSAEVSAQIDMLTDILQNFLNSIRSGNYIPVPTSDQCSPYCPAISWCWQANPERTDF